MRAGNKIIYCLAHQRQRGEELKEGGEKEREKEKNKRSEKKRGMV